MVQIATSTSHSLSFHINIIDKSLFKLSSLFAIQSFSLMAPSPQEEVMNATRDENYKFHGVVVLIVVVLLFTVFLFSLLLYFYLRYRRHLQKEESERIRRKPHSKDQRGSMGGSLMLES